MKNKCPHCGSANTTRFQWYGGENFQFWTCWDCDFMFCIQIGRYKYEATPERTVDSRCSCSSEHYNINHSI